MLAAGVDSFPVNLSVVIPAFNEEDRLPATLEEILAFADQASECIEIIVVDDGSEDRTSEVAAEMLTGRKNNALVHLGRNVGKGGAVRAGIAASTGRLIMYIDADGATPFLEHLKLATAISDGADIAIGKRVTSQRSLLRRILGRGFSFLSGLVLGLEFSDPQCGFKMFTRSSASTTVVPAVEDGYLADLEVLLKAKALNLRVSEVPITWKEKAGSKVNLIKDPWEMFMGLWRLRHLAR